MAIYVQLETEEQFAEYVNSGKRFVFKHSISCPISYSVKSDVDSVESTVGLIVVQKSRGLSSRVAEITGVKHESPQALVFENGECVYNASHYDIEGWRISDLLDE